MLDERQFAQIGSALGDITNQRATPGSSTGGGSFSYTPDQLRDLVTEWMDLAADYKRSMAHVQDLTKVEGPGADYVSDSLASVASSSGGAYVRSLEGKYNYCLDQAQKLQDTLDDYLGMEHHNIAVINNAGPRDGI